MTPGSILLDTKFLYPDGSTGKKFIINLNDGTQVPYIFVKVTSQSRHFNVTAFCQNQDRIPNFYLPAGCCYFQKHSWVELKRYFEFDTSWVLRKNLDGEIQKHAELPNEILKDLIQCAIDSSDILGNQVEELERTFNSITV